MKTMFRITILLAMLVNSGFADVPIDCAVVGSGKELTVTVNLDTPHPGEMIIRTPDGRMVWLQAAHIPFTFPVTDNFEELPGFVLDIQSRGSWFNDWGEPEAALIFSVDGEYVLEIAEDIESADSNSSTLSCLFSASVNSPANKN